MSVYLTLTRSIQHDILFYLVMRANDYPNSVLFEVDLELDNTILSHVKI